MSDVLKASLGELIRSRRALRAQEEDSQEITLPNKELARMLNTDVTTLKRWIREGHLHAIRVTEHTMSTTWRAIGEFSRKDAER